MSIRILLADDHKIMREGLRTLLAQERDMEVVGEAQDGRATLQLARKAAPDVVIMDVVMPDLNGIEATRRIVADLPRTKVIALSMHSDKRFVVEMLKAGASAYLLKDCASEELIRSVRAVLADRTYLSPAVADIVLEDYVRHVPRDQVSAFSILTAREREILQLVAEGKVTKEIASCLHVSVKTVETHRKRIMEKLEVHSVADLVKYAVREGLTSLES